MNKDLKDGLKKILILDTLLTSTDSLGKILEDIEDELEELFGKSQKKALNIEEFLNKENFK